MTKNSEIFAPYGERLMTTTSKAPSDEALTAHDRHIIDYWTTYIGVAKQTPTTAANIADKQVLNNVEPLLRLVLRLTSHAAATGAVTRAKTVVGIVNPEHRKLIDEFADFIDTPPQYEELRMVRDYRHELARKWIPLQAIILALLASKATPPAAHKEERDE